MGEKIQTGFPPTVFPQKQVFFSDFWGLSYI